MRKVLRSAGFALIFLPEPFTTPLGLALLGASYIFARFSRVDTPPYLRHLIKLYLHEKYISSSVIHHKLKQKLQDSEWRYQPKKDVSCGIDSNRLMLRFGKDMTIEFAEPVNPIRHSMKQRWAGYVWPGAPPDIRTTETASRIIDTSRLSRRYLEAACGISRKPVEKIIHHTLNRQTIEHTMDRSRRSAGYAAASKTAREAALDKAVHHSMKQNLFGCVLPTVTVYEQKVNVHTMDGSRLLHQYAKTMPSRFAEPHANIVRTFNPAKVSLVPGIA